MPAAKKSNATPRWFFGPQPEHNKPTHRVTYQGDCLKWQYPEWTPTPRPKKTRGEVTHFSASSRLRILEWINKVNWEHVGKCLFITTTYPGTCFPESNDAMNIDRDLFRRALEKVLGKKVCMLWRIEWIERQTGVEKNHIYPHIHWLVFDVAYVHWAIVNRLWREAIGYAKKTVTQTKQAYSKRGALAYVSKYCAKGSSSLVIAAYLNNTLNGRRWGILRPELMPMHDEHHFEAIDGKYMQDAWTAAVEGLAYRNVHGNKSFTLFGDQAREIGNFLFGIGVDGEVHDV